MRIVVIVITSLPLIFGLSLFVYLYIFFRGSYTSPAEVIDVKNKPKKRNVKDFIYYPVYKFKHNGIEIIKESKVGYNLRKPYKIGDIISVIYNNDMNIVISKDYKDFVTITAILLTGGLLLFIAVIYFLYFNF